MYLDLVLCAMACQQGASRDTDWTGVACMGLVGGDGVWLVLLAFRLAYEQPLAESGGREARAMLRVRKDASGWLWLWRARAVELTGTRP